MGLYEQMQTTCQTLQTKRDALAQDCEAQRTKMHDRAKSYADNRPWYQKAWEWLTSALDGLFKKLEEVRNKITEEVGKILTSIGEWLAGPPLLASSWTKWQTVAENTGKTTGKMDLNHVGHAVEWKGTGATAYQETVKQQVGAGQVVTTMVQELQKFLEKHLTAVLDYITKMKTACVNLVASFVEAAVQFLGVEDPLTWSDILSKCGGFLADCVKTVDEVLNNMIDYIKTGAQSFADIKKASVAVYQLPGGTSNWPTPGVNIRSSEKPPTRNQDPWQPS